MEMHAMRGTNYGVNIVILDTCCCAVLIAVLEILQIVNSEALVRKSNRYKSQWPNLRICPAWGQLGITYFGLARAKRASTV
jgi:hypothetical protein